MKVLQLRLSIEIRDGFVVLEMLSLPEICMTFESTSLPLLATRQCKAAMLLIHVSLIVPQIGG